VWAQAQSCDELVRYRDGQLFNDWEQATREHGRGIRKLDILAEGRLDLMKLRDELVQHSNSVDKAAVYAVVVLSARQVVNGIAAGLDVNPATGLLVRGAKAAGRRLTAKQAETALRGGTLVQSLVQDQAAEVAAQLAVEKIPVVGGTLAAIWDFANYVREMKVIDDTQRVTREQIRRVETAIARIEEQINQQPDTASQLAAISAIKEGIDLYCSKPAHAGFDYAGVWDANMRVEFPTNSIHCSGTFSVRPTATAGEFLAEGSYDCVRHLKPGVRLKPGVSPRYSFKSRSRWQPVSDTSMRSVSFGLQETADHYGSSGTSYPYERMGARLHHVRHYDGGRHEEVLTKRP
jgi:hypothetical protein